MNVGMSAEWSEFVERLAMDGSLVQASFSNPRGSAGAGAPARLAVRPVRLKGGLVYQFARQRNNQVFHENVAAERLPEALTAAMDEYRQALFKTPEADVQVLANKKGKFTLIKRPPTAAARPAAAAAAGKLAHNRGKAYVLPEGEPVPFLAALGVMTESGQVVKAKYDKFRQINRFLEMVADVLPELPRGKELTIVDFGCGKSYLTFALYHLLAIKERLPVRIVGLDLKRDVIESCTRLAERLRWDKLEFFVGDIADYTGSDRVDMVVTLHACDTATDAALLQAIGWDAAVILSVPCCQHELFRQVSQPLLKPLLKHGILKERFAALVTDAVRAQLLEMAGYRTQLLEFVDLEHTPKNILIRAVRGGAKGDPAELADQYGRFKTFLGIAPFMDGKWEKAAGRSGD